MTERKQYFTRGGDRGVQIGLEIMSKYVAALLSNPRVITNGNGVSYTDREVIEYAKEMTEKTIKEWEDGK